MKRFTETTKFDDANFRKLSPKLKVAWDFVLSRCSHVGLWNPDFENLSFFVGEKVTKEEFDAAFRGMFTVMSNDKYHGLYFIHGFVFFQQGCLSPNKKSHIALIEFFSENEELKDTYTQNCFAFFNAIAMPLQCHSNGIAMGTSISNSLFFSLNTSGASNRSDASAPSSYPVPTEHSGGTVVTQWGDSGVAEGKEREVIELKPVNKPKKNPSKAVTGLPFHELALMWNANCGNLPKVEKMTPERQAKTRKVFHDLTTEQWLKAISMMTNSKFCNGHNDRGWVATFDTLLRDYVQTLEGKYEDRKPKTEAKKPMMFSP